MEGEGRTEDPARLGEQPPGPGASHRLHDADIADRAVRPGFLGETAPDIGGEAPPPGRADRPGEIRRGAVVGAVVERCRFRIDHVHGDHGETAGLEG
jgi:hypothetical protein